MLTIYPDIKFKNQLIDISKSSLNECIQCGNCSVVCSLAPEDKPFPRKEMIWAGWGIKENLVGNVDVWLCHQCGDCSTYCPRDVKPADVLSAIRQLSYQHYAKPVILGTILSKPAFLPIAILIPVVIISVILFFAGKFQIPEGEVNYSKFFPHAWLNLSFSLISFLFYGMAIYGLKKFIDAMKNQFSEFIPVHGFLKGLWNIKKEVLSHSKFSNCKSQNSRRISHFLVFYGFILLLLVTIYAIFATLSHQYPLTFTNPFKLAGNVAGLMLIAGLSLMIYNRIVNRKDFGNSNYSDWLLLVSLLLLTVSGGMVEIARFQNWNLAYHLYFFHLVSVWFTVMYLPYTKFGHVLYRISALAFCKFDKKKINI